MYTLGKQLLSLSLLLQLLLSPLGAFAVGSYTTAQIDPSTLLQLHDHSDMPMSMTEQGDQSHSQQPATCCPNGDCGSGHCAFCLWLPTSPSALMAISDTQPAESLLSTWFVSLSVDTPYRPPIL